MWTFQFTFLTNSKQFRKLRIMIDRNNVIIYINYSLKIPNNRRVKAMIKLRGLAAMMLVVLTFFASTNSTNAAEVDQSEKFQTNGEENLSLAGDNYLEESITPFGFYLYKDVDFPSSQTYSTSADVPATYYYEAFSGGYWYKGWTSLYKTVKLTNGNWQGHYRGKVSAWVE